MAINICMEAVQLITNMIKQNNSQYFFDHKKQLQEYFEDIQNEKQLNMIQMMIDVSKGDSQIATDIQKLFKEKKSYKEQETNSFLEEVREKNKKGIGICFLNNNGQFIITDEQTRKLLEISNNPSKSQHIFSFSSEATLQSLSKTFTNFYGTTYPSFLLGEDEVNKEFKMTIYSQRTQKNAIKKLGNYKDIDVERLRQMMTQKKQESNKIPKINDEEKFKIICLKSLEVKFQKVRLQVDVTFLESIKMQNDFQGGELLDIMVSENQEQCVLKCEIRHSEFEQISKEQIHQDRKIMNFQQKWQKKLQDQKKAIQAKINNQQIIEQNNPKKKKKIQKQQQKQQQKTKVEEQYQESEQEEDDGYQDSREYWSTKLRPIFRKKFT